MIFDLFFTFISKAVLWMAGLMNGWPTESLSATYQLQDAVYSFLRLEVVGGLLGMVDAQSLVFGIGVLFGLWTLTLILRVAASVTSALTPGGLI